MSKTSERHAEMATVAEMTEEYRAEIDHYKARLAEAERLLERIKKRATHHPDDTDKDRARQLYHIESIARAFLERDKP